MESSREPSKKLLKNTNPKKGGEKVKKQVKGFTLIELVVVMAIIAILALLIIGAILAARLTARNTQRTGDVRTFQTALESYFATNKSYPGTVGTAEVMYTGASKTTMASYLTNLPAHDPSGSTADNREQYCPLSTTTYMLLYVAEPTTVPTSLTTCTGGTYTLPGGATDFSVK